MLMPLAAITADTVCPSRTGRGRHYPLFRNEKPVTMPGETSSPLRREVLLLSLCRTAHLRTPPHDAPLSERVCALCLRARATARDETNELATTA
ncbi:hypothetical protein SAMN04487819_12220 [Actinopolyspora alba]|uniref:Uncharacterized protein n=1 Tax=Actinopolyspora alba TaxID=673379 RepID=A0A1I2CIC5_9ACTN|nr:hypothetical protein [Actinopolyspora alba]SFE67902.1 hypothetical protein SAMN04487819_12220 [Actinopolyspora alba]